MKLSVLTSHYLISPTTHKPPSSSPIPHIRRPPSSHQFDSKSRQPLPICNRRDPCQTPKSASSQIPRRYRDHTELHPQLHALADPTYLPTTSPSPSSAFFESNIHTFKMGGRLSKPKSADHLSEAPGASPAAPAARFAKGRINQRVRPVFDTCTSDGSRLLICY